MGLIVGDEYRSHPYSFVPGGVSVCVLYVGVDSGNELIYQDVKNPQNYCDRVLRNHGDVQKVWIKDNGFTLFNRDDQPS
jgi:hypothetical protein